MMSFNYDKDKTYILACSFGPDSMALFHMLLKDGYKFVVCHINYNTRDESKFEENSLFQYCKKHDVPMYLKSVHYENSFGNFEAWAREVRYNFFKEIYMKFKCSGLFVAHHQDDLIETYIMQKDRQMIIPYYGILEETIIKDMKVLRPLLGYTKKELELYCKNNDVPYSIDKTNLENIHTRNKIRHNIIEKLTLDERTKLLSDIKSLNEQREKETQNIKECFDSLQNINIERFNTLSINSKVFALYELIMNYGSFYSMSRKRALEIIKIIESRKPNIKVFLKDDLYIVKEYGSLKVKRYCLIQGYSYVIDKPMKLKTEYFEIDFTKNTDNRNVFINDYPLTIRTYQPGDYIMINNVKRKVRRLFIDWKIPEEIRKYWPIIENSKKEIIYIPRYQKNFVFDESSNFKIYIK